jgi:hypothetical protein
MRRVIAFRLGSSPQHTVHVDYVLNKYQASVPVNLIKTPGDFTTPATVTTDPNPVFAELQPTVPPKPVEAAAPAEAEDAETGRSRARRRTGRCCTCCGNAVPRSERGQALIQVLSKCYPSAIQVLIYAQRTIVLGTSDA